MRPSPGAWTLGWTLLESACGEILTMRVDVLTLFPGLFDPFLREGIVGIARAKGLLHVDLVDFRDCTTDRHRSVDDRPFGGGPGMVLKPEPIFAAVEQIEGRRAAGGSGTPIRKIMLTPQGRRLEQPLVADLARETELLLLCGRYEGFDERIRIGMAWEEVSLGDFVLSGGEVAALALIDGLARLLPGAVGHPDSTRLESFENGLLDYPQYTRPRSFRGMEVPQVLLTGDHARIESWRRDQALRRTRSRRADLLASRASTSRAPSRRGSENLMPHDEPGRSPIVASPVPPPPPPDGS